MTGVPEQDVARAIEDPMQRNGEFDRTEIGAEMTSGPRHVLDEESADLLGEVAELFGVQRLQASRRTGLREESHLASLGRSNVAIASAGGDSSSGSSSGNIGVGFSIPINNAKRVAQEIISNGKATHGQFGVSVKAKAAGSSSSGFSVGAEVATVESGSAADKAGIKVGDVVTKFQNLTISDPNQLTAAVREQPAGATVKVTVLRGGQQKDLDVTLGTAAEQ